MSEQSFEVVYSFIGQLEGLSSTSVLMMINGFLITYLHTGSFYAFYMWHFLQCNMGKHAILRTVIIAIIIIKFLQKGPRKKQSESYLDM